jgi:hypothetical protein
VNLLLRIALPLGCADSSLLPWYGWRVAGQAKGYLKNLLDNQAIFRFLSMRQPDVLREFSNLVEVETLDK